MQPGSKMLKNNLKKYRVMNKFILIVILLVTLPAVALGNNAAPYTDEALQKINKAITDTPKEEPGPTVSREEFHRQNVDYFTKVFAKAGYSYSETIDKIVDDMKSNPKSIPDDRETVYNKIYMLLHIMMSECDSDKIDCLKFYPAKTGESIQWFLKNSGFSVQEHEQTK